MADFVDNQTESQETLYNAADAARKRRDLRRKKIMNSPEERMRRLMGINGGTRDSSTSLDRESSLQPPTSCFSDVYEEHSPSVARRSVSQPREDSGATRRNVNWERQYSEDLNSNSAQQMSGNPAVQWGQLAQDFMSPDSPLNAVNASLFGEQATDTELEKRVQAITLQFNRWRYVLSLIMGLIIRIVFMLNLGDDYVESIFYPFIALEVCFVGYQKAIGLELGGCIGGLWIMMLKLSGVQPQLIDSYKQLTGVVTAAMEDFCAFFFSFAMVHLFAESFS